jgi:tRNA-intron endonuclease
MNKKISIVKKGKYYYANDNFSTFFDKGFGLKLERKKYILNDFEVQYLFEKKKIIIEKEPLGFKNFDIQKYLVFKDLRSKGYVLKTALKYGFDFRVYNKGLKNKHEHAPWLLNVINSKINNIKVKDLISSNRISNTSKKKYILAFVDNENSITYIENTRKKFV